MGTFDEATYLSAVQSGDFSQLLEPQRRLLERLRANPALHRGDPSEAMTELTESAARMVGVARVGLWRFDPTHTQLVCLDLYLRHGARHEQGLIVPFRAAPAYFRALEAGQVVAAEDTFTDPRTRELERSYLIANQVGASLDVPVLIDGELVGVLCHEHIGGARRWRAWERTTAASLADCAALVLGERRPG